MFKRFALIPLTNLRSGLSLLGAVLLLGGLVSAAVIWRSDDGAPGDGEMANPAAALPPSDSRKQSREIEIYYGKAGLLLESWSEKLHGRALAELVLVGAISAAAGCFLWASRLPP